MDKKSFFFFIMTIYYFILKTFFNYLVIWMRKVFTGLSQTNTVLYAALKDGFLQSKTWKFYEKRKVATLVYTDEKYLLPLCAISKLNYIRKHIYSTSSGFWTLLMKTVYEYLEERCVLYKNRRKIKEKLPFIISWSNERKQLH